MTRAYSLDKSVLEDLSMRSGDMNHGHRRVGRGYTGSWLQLLFVCYQGFGAMTMAVAGALCEVWVS